MYDPAVVDANDQFPPRFKPVVVMKSRFPRKKVGVEKNKYFTWD
jgi:hypothetical protein